MTTRPQSKFTHLTSAEFTAGLRELAADVGVLRAWDGLEWPWGAEVVGDRQGGVRVGDQADASPLDMVRARPLPRPVGSLPATPWSEWPSPTMFSLLGRGIDARPVVSQASP